jgi:hypothetical protein
LQQGYQMATTQHRSGVVEGTVFGVDERWMTAQVAGQAAQEIG